MSKAKAVRITAQGYAVPLAILFWTVGMKLVDVSLGMFNLGNALEGQTEVGVVGALMVLAAGGLACYAIMPFGAWLEVA